MANEIKTVAIYCGSNNGREESYKKTFKRTGRSFSQT